MKLWKYVYLNSTYIVIAATAREARNKLFDKQVHGVTEAQLICLEADIAWVHSNTVYGV